MVYLEDMGQFLSVCGEPLRRTSDHHARWSAAKSDLSLLTRERWNMLCASVPDILVRDLWCVRPVCSLSKASTKQEIKIKFRHASPTPVLEHVWDIHCCYKPFSVYPHSHHWEWVCSQVYHTRAAVPALINDVTSFTRIWMFFFLHRFLLYSRWTVLPMSYCSISQCISV